MSFNQLYFWSLSVLCLTSCNLIDVNDPPAPPTQVAVIGGNSSQCLSRTFENLSDYLDGKASENGSLATLLSCADSALEQFSNSVRGADKNRYDRSELTAFLNRYFMESKSPADEKLLNLFFFLKSSLIGGKSSEITQAELGKFRLIIADLNRLIPSIELKLKNSELNKVPFGPSHLNFLKPELMNLSNTLGGRVDTFKTHLKISELVTKLSLIPDLKKLEWFTNPSDVLTLVNFVKTDVLQLGNDQYIKPGDWRSLFSKLTSLSIWSYQLNWLFNKSSNPFSDFSIQKINELAKSLPKTWDDLSNPEISIQRVTRLPMQLKNSKAIFGYTNKSFSEILGFFVKSLASNIKDKPLEYFGVEQIKDFSATIQSWTLIQKLTNLALTEINPKFKWDSDHSISSEENRFKFKISDLQKIGAASRPVFQNLYYSKLIVKKSNNEIIRRPYSEFFSTILQSHPIWNRPDGAFRPLIVQNRIQTEEYSAAELAVRLLFWMTNSRLFESFGTTPRDSRGLINHMTKSDFDQIYKGLRNFGIEVNWFDPKTWNAAELRHRESDLFMWSSNGNQLMELHEAVEMFTSLVSVKIAAVEMHKAVLKICDNSNRPDFTGYNQVKTNCLFPSIFLGDQLELIKKSLPGFVSYYEKVGAEKQADLRSSIEKMFRIPNQEYSGYVTTERVGALMQYEEMLLSRFDSNHSQTLESTELEPIFNHMENILKTASKSEKKSRNRAILAYLLKTGKMPNASMLRGIDFWLFEMDPDGWEFSADRNRILEVFSAVSLQISNNPTVETKETAPNNN